MYANRFRPLLPFILLALVIFACDQSRVFEENVEFKHRFWAVGDEPAFEFVVADSAQAFNLYYNVRNSVDYPWDRIFVTWSLYDSTGSELAKKLVYNDLFDPAGRPYGESGIGDLYDHQFLLASDYRFSHAGKYTIKLVQFSRQDTLHGVLAVGVRVERDSEKP